MKQARSAVHARERWSRPHWPRRVEPGITPSQPVTLTWATFTDAANQAGISRRYGGIHFKAAGLIGREIGRLIGYKAFIKAERSWSDRALDF